MQRPSDTWVARFYAECGREISLSMNTLHTLNSWAVTVILALLSTLAVIRHFPNVISYGLLILGASLVLRFFIRSLLAYTNLERFNRLQSAALMLLRSPDPDADDVARFDEVLDRLYYQWACPLPKWRLVWSNAKLAGFSYLFAALALVTVWTGLALRNLWQAQLLSLGGLAIVLGEAYLFFRAPYFRHVPSPTQETFGPRPEQSSGSIPTMKALVHWLRRNALALGYWGLLGVLAAVIVAMNWHGIQSTVRNAWDAEPAVLPVGSTPSPEATSMVPAP
jgi:hypothetical protein